MTSVPEQGSVIQRKDGQLIVPDQPIIPYIEGGGIRSLNVTLRQVLDLVRVAIKYALDNGRRSVTLVHKGNIMKFTEGGFRDWGYELAREEFGDQTHTEDDAPDSPGLLIKDRIADSVFQQVLTRTQDVGVRRRGHRQHVATRSPW